MKDVRDSSLSISSLERYGITSVDERKIKKLAVDYLFQDNILTKENIDLSSSTAFSFLNNRISFQEFFEKKDKVAKALQACGLKKGDKIAVLSSNLPETAYIEYGSMVVGVVCDFIDPRTKSDTLLEILKNEDPKAIVILDKIEYPVLSPIIEKIEEETAVKQIITVPALLSAPKMLRLASGIKDKFSKPKTLTTSGIELLDYESIIADSRYTNLERAIYLPDETAIITHTSGSSTGIPKPIELTHENMNSISYQHELANVAIPPKSKMLHILPYFAAYGSACATHMSLCLGYELQEVAEFDISKVGRLIAQYKPNLVFGTPSWYLAMLDDPKLQNKRFDFLQIIVSGGDSMTISDEIRLNEWLKNHGCKVRLTKGYGLSEVSGCGVYTPSEEYNKLGSVGITLPLTNIALINPDTKELSKFKGKDTITGEALLTGPSVSTKLTRENYEYINGMLFLKTGDMMMMDKDGNLTHIERMDKTFTRYDGYKVHPGNIEKKIDAYNLFEGCTIVSYMDKSKSGKMPAAYVIVKEGEKRSNEELVREIMELMVNDKTLTTRDIPSKWIFLETFPLTLMSKIDYRLLESTVLERESVDVTFKESNIDFSYELVSKNSEALKMLLK